MPLAKPILTVIVQQPSRCAARICAVLANCGISVEGMTGSSSLSQDVISATATAGNGLSRSCEIYGSKLVEHLIRRKYPVYPREVVVGMAADAVEQEAKADGITPGEAYTKILQAQKLYLKSWAGKQARILAMKWYVQRRYADDLESWRKEAQTR